MCGRYFISNFTKSRLEEFFFLSNIIESTLKKHKDMTVKTSGEIFPTDNVPVIAKNRKNETKTFIMKWGFKAFEGGSLLINARSETAASKPTFSESYNYHRCLVPASYYFEWKQEQGEKIKHAISPKDKESFFMAGLYRLNEQEVPVFTILTREASPYIIDIHNRMPVILEEEDAKKWLNYSVNPDDIVSQALLSMDYHQE